MVSRVTNKNSGTKCTILDTNMAIAILAFLIKDGRYRVYKYWAIK